MKSYEIVLEGFDGSTSDTDHLIVWVHSASKELLDLFIDRKGFKVDQCYEIDLGENPRKEDGVDYFLYSENDLPEPVMRNQKNLSISLLRENLLKWINAKSKGYNVKY